MDSEELLADFPLIRRLVGLRERSSIELDRESYKQSIINLLVQAGKVAKAAGHGRPASNPFGKADPGLMLIEIENLLRDIENLALYAQLLILNETDSSSEQR